MSEIRKEIFVSVPMTGKTNEEIERSIQMAKQDYLHAYGLSAKDVLFVSNANEHIDDEIDTGASTQVRHKNVWYLGLALMKLSRCDGAVFGGDWNEANGCQIELEACRRYNIPILEIVKRSNDVDDERWNKFKYSESCIRFRKRHNTSILWRNADGTEEFELNP